MATGRYMLCTVCGSEFFLSASNYWLRCPLHRMARTNGRLVRCPKCDKRVPMACDDCSIFCLGDPSEAKSWKSMMHLRLRDDGSDGGGE